jgi:hypothetical protein
MKISDDQLANWTKPWFENEEEKAETTKELVKSAIDKHPILKNLHIRVFAKGSYPNNTNVRHDSDIDIAVELKEMIQLEYAPGINFSNTGLSSYEGISELDFKSHVISALSTEFGDNADSTGNKIIKIRGSDKILDADIIPCTTYQYHYPNGHFEGIQLILNISDGKIHANYPDQHLKNGTDKNVATSRRYKNIVRILKNAENYLVENENMTDYHSYMIESLAFNVLNSTYLEKGTWRGIIEDLCIEAWTYLEVNEPESENLRWVEVNNHKFLFHDHQKWTREDAKNFIMSIYNLIKN